MSPLDLKWRTAYMLNGTSFWPTCSIQLISLQKALTTKRPNMIRSVLPGFWKPVQIRETRITGYEIHQHSIVIYVCFTSVRGDFYQWILLLDFMRLNLYQHKPHSYISEADIYAGGVCMSHAKASTGEDNGSIFLHCSKTWIYGSYLIFRHSLH